MLDGQRMVSIVLVAFALALFLIVRKLHKPNVEQEAVSKSDRRKRNSGGVSV